MISWPQNDRTNHRFSTVFRQNGQNFEAQNFGHFGEKRSRSDDFRPFSRHVENVRKSALSIRRKFDKCQVFDILPNGHKNWPTVVSFPVNFGRKIWSNWSKLRKLQRSSQFWLGKAKVDPNLWSAHAYRRAGSTIRRRRRRGPRLEGAVRFLCFPTKACLAGREML